ncbi:hypothetical protein [Marinomonas ostreistagni]|uniref:Uncharacterized protein n=1 Tax=Marinomonas ostreistagni TaxID=359209 RepID=A0ABS0ZH11_9GAMM|nr:hypothetical protein [Marinomonas ostreistagni]MBJ7552336.1 hypothetical protein [Marinomonas ostreistagni]
MTVFLTLVIATGVSAVMLLASIWWYWRTKRNLSSVAEDEEDVDVPDSDKESLVEAVASETVKGPSQKEKWLELLSQQSALCQELIEGQKGSGGDVLTLQCWQTFLEIERGLVEQDSANVADYLNQFEFVLERLKQAQEIDALLKRLSVSNQMLKQLNKIVQKTGDAAFEQMNKTAQLNLQLDQLQDSLQREVALDQELAEIRAELASLYELGEQLKLSSNSSAKSDEEYMGMLSEFLGSASSDSFLKPIKSELDEKVDELQHLSDYRSQVIEELKGQLKSLRDTSDGQHDHLAFYDIAFARLEKSLLESNKVIKALEHKLESLQTIKYNLNVDMRKREEELRAKDAKLKASGQEAKLRAQSAIAREQSSVDAIANFMDTAPLTAEYANFEEVQGEKLATLQQLVNESELYVNVLERDLDKERLEHEQLLARLESDHSQSLTLSPHEEDELNNLREVNSELESEKISLLEQLSNTTEDTEAVEELQRKIKELDMKIETVQVNYVNMEERYLNSLMS